MDRSVRADARAARVESVEMVRRAATYQSAFAVRIAFAALGWWRQACCSAGTRARGRRGGRVGRRLTDVEDSVSGHARPYVVDLRRLPSVPLSTAAGMLASAVVGCRGATSAASRAAARCIGRGGSEGVRRGFALLLLGDRAQPRGRLAPAEREGVGAEASGAGDEQRHAAGA